MSNAIELTNETINSVMPEINVTTQIITNNQAASNDEVINSKTYTFISGEDMLSFDYDGLGRQTLATRNNSSVGYTYDGLGRLETTTTNGRTLTYSYDGAGRRSKLKHPDNFYVNYAYDSSGALTSIKEYNSKELVSYGYDNYGRLATITRNNGVVSSLGYNNAGQVQNFDHASINNASFDYNPSSQMVNRVVSNANFQIKIPTISQESYEVNNLNQYDSVGTKNISHDNAGNLTDYDSWSYTYNAHNRLTSANKTGTSLSLGYDPTGRLESSTLNGSKTNFLYDGDELVGEYNSSGSLINRYVHGIAEDDPLVWYIGSGTSNSRYLIADERGSIVAETSSTGAISTIHQYGPYGEPENTSTSRFRYTGQILLPGTELYHYKARIYHPKLGRFLQTDPIGYEDGMNWYAYVGNDPVNGVDPTGEAQKGLGSKLAAIGSSICKKGCKNGAQYYAGPKAQAEYMTRKNAMTQLKKDAKIPKSQKPESVNKVKMKDQNGQTVKDSNGNVVKTTEYSHTTTDNKKVVIQDHSAGHKDFSGESAEPHLNVRPSENTKTGTVEGTKKHYTFETKG